MSLHNVICTRVTIVVCAIICLPIAINCIFGRMQALQTYNEESSKSAFVHGMFSCGTSKEVRKPILFMDHINRTNWLELENILPSLPVLSADESKNAVNQISAGSYEQNVVVNEWRLIISGFADQSSHAFGHSNAEEINVNYLLPRTKSFVTTNGIADAINWNREVDAKYDIANGLHIYEKYGYEQLFQRVAGKSVDLYVWINKSDQWLDIKYHDNSFQKRNVVSSEWLGAFVRGGAFQPNSLTMPFIFGGRPAIQFPSECLWVRSYAYSGATYNILRWKLSGRDSPNDNAGKNVSWYLTVITDAAQDNLPRVIYMSTYSAFDKLPQCRLWLSYAYAPQGPKNIMAPAAVEVYVVREATPEIKCELIKVAVSLNTLESMESEIN